MLRNLLELLDLICKLLNLSNEYFSRRNIILKYFGHILITNWIKKSKSLSSIRIDDKTIDDPLEIAETLNEHFLKSFNQSGNHLLTVNEENSSGVSLQSIEINENIVRMTIKSLPSKFSEDHDAFSYVLLKGGGEIIVIQLTRLYKLSLSNGQLLQDWKKVLFFQLRKRQLLHQYRQPKIY